MDERETDILAGLHTDAVDARNGYAEAVKDAEPDAGTVLGLFAKMQDLHNAAAEELAAELGRLGARPDYSGSFMSVVHESIIKLRSLVGKLDDSALAGLIDGEQRNLARYDEAIGSGDLGAASLALVQRQRAVLSRAISLLQAQAADAPARG
jgi:uncharacterized protein (TIGR02284 family)